MNDLTTSLTPPLSERYSYRDEWKALGRFLQRPNAPNRASGFSNRAVVAVFRLYALDALLMLSLAVVAVIVVALGVEIPENRLNAFELTPGWIAVIVIGAPITEEILFRSWLSGRPGHIVSGLLAGGAVLGLGAVGEDQTLSALTIISALALVLVAIIATLYVTRDKPPIRWFARGFPLIFWIVTIGFGLIHLINYESSNALFLLPLIVPQVIAGTLFGYARVQYGLWGAILLHALHNGSAVAAMLIAQQMMPAAA